MPRVKKAGTEEWKKHMKIIGFKKGYTPWNKGKKLHYKPKGMLGKKHTEEYKEKMRNIRLGKDNPNWKGNEVKLRGLHDWIRRHKPKPEFCEDCGFVKPYDLANISGQYKRDVNDFEWLCRKCHMKKDGRAIKVLKNLKQFK